MSYRGWSSIKKIMEVTLEREKFFTSLVTRVERQLSLGQIIKGSCGMTARPQNIGILGNNKVELWDPVLGDVSELHPPKVC